MTNRLVAVLAYLMLVGFVGILVWNVPRLDLGIVVLSTLLLAGWDIYQTAGERDKQS